MAPKAQTNFVKPKSSAYKDKTKPADVRLSNIQAAKAVCDAIRTSLGPRGMDKMIQASNGEVTITNDGATILKQMNVIHPAAKMLVELSRAQDVEAGDGTTSVVVIAGALLEAAERLLAKGIHPSAISDSFQRCARKAVDILNSMSRPIELKDEEELIKSASTSLNSKVVSQQSSLLAPIAVNAVLKVAEAGDHPSVDLKDIKVIRSLGGTVEDTELVEGLVFTHRSSGTNAPKRVEKAKIALIQFCISPPKTDMDHNVVVSDYAAMDRVLKEERAYILNIVKQIKKAGCNVLLVQKSILRDAVSDLAQHFLDKIKVLVVKDIDREDIEFVCKSLSCRPIASLDHFVAESLVNADLVSEVASGTNKFVKITGIQNRGRTVSIIVRGSNKLVLDEAARSLHDALCVIRCLVKKRALIAGGGAPEIEMALQLAAYSQTVEGVDAYCFRAFAEALEVIPSTLAENAGLNPISTVTELRNRHAQGEKNAGINVRKGAITDILAENVVQPLLVSTSAITLASELVRSLLKIDDIMDHNVVVSDYAAMDRVLKEERAYILNIVKQIKKAGCNVLLVQKSILRDAVSDLAQHFLDKIKVLVVKDIDREDIEFVCKSLSCRPIASLDHFVAESLVNADLVSEVASGTNKFVKITGIQNRGRTVSIIVRGSNKLVLDEAARSLHDALCVIRCLVKKRALIAGGGAPEIEMALQLAAYSQTVEGVDAYCFRAFAEALEVIPSTLAENAGLNPISTVTELRNRHAQGEKNAGINVRKGAITDILAENVVQPLLVSTSAITLASELVRSLLKIDDIVNTIS